MQQILVLTNFECVYICDFLNLKADWKSKGCSSSKNIVKGFLSQADVDSNFHVQNLCFGVEAVTIILWTL